MVIGAKRRSPLFLRDRLVATGQPEELQSDR